MKRKESNKKLSISKRTIANLNNLGMSRILGGNLWETLTEPSIDPDFCTGGAGCPDNTNSCVTACIYSVNPPC